MKDERELIDVLKDELNFLEKGGYRHPTRQPWRYQFLFEDSPTCLNYGCIGTPHACTECALIRLVPLGCRDNATPCRDIPLNAEGETLRQLYAYADEQEIEEKYAAWLRRTIALITEEKHANGSLDSHAA